MDTAEDVNVTDVAGANVGLRTRAGLFASSTVMKFIGRFHLDVSARSPFVDQRRRLPEAYSSREQL